MKKVLFLVVLCIISVSMFSCDDKEISEVFSEDTTLEGIKFVGVAEGVKIKFSEKNTTLAISRVCGETISLNANLPLGAKIIEVSEGLTLKSDTTFDVKLNVSEEFFLVQAEDLLKTEKYKVSIVNDKVDLALHLIEQTFQKDSSFIWKHERNESGVLVSSRLVNVDNDKNFKLFEHKCNSSDFVTSTTYTTNMHKQYTYVWKYDNETLVSYEKQFFNQLPSHHLVECNEDNLIVSLTEMNTFSYAVNKIEYTYDDKKRISKQTDPRYYYDQIYIYDNKGRIASTGEFAYEYDSFGNIVKKTITNSGFSLHHYTFNEDGNMLTEKSSGSNGTVYSEYQYSYFENKRVSKVTKVGEVWSKIYNEDGSYKFTTEREFHNSTTKEVTVYDVKHLKLEETVEKTTTFTNIDLTQVELTYSVFEYNGDGLCVKETQTVDKKDGSPVSIKLIESEFNSSNLCVKRTTKTDGKVTTVNIKEYNNDGKVTESAYYDSDGEKHRSYFYHYTSYNKIESYILEYFESGDVQEVVREYHENWNMKSQTTTYSTHDVLTYVRAYTYKDDGHSLLRIETKEYEEGLLVSSSLTEFDSEGNQTSYTVYDADGNVVSIQKNQKNLRRSNAHQFDGEIEIAF